MHAFQGLFAEYNRDARMNFACVYFRYLLGTTWRNACEIYLHRNSNKGHVYKGACTYVLNSPAANTRRRRDDGISGGPQQSPARVRGLLLSLRGDELAVALLPP